MKEIKKIVFNRLPNAAPYNFCAQAAYSLMNIGEGVRYTPAIANSIHFLFYLQR